LMELASQRMLFHCDCLYYYLGGALQLPSFVSRRCAAMLLLYWRQRLVRRLTHAHAILVLFLFSILNLCVLRVPTFMFTWGTQHSYTIAKQCTRGNIYYQSYSLMCICRFLNSNRLPCDEMLELLDEHFSPSAVKLVADDNDDDDDDDDDDELEGAAASPTKRSYSLAIVSGANGARLTHSHRLQWHFVRQSLLLWRAITHDMFRLWSLAEQDMLSNPQDGGGTPYVLKDTGQGIQRVQPCPRTYRAMQVVHSTALSYINAQDVFVSTLER